MHIDVVDNPLLSALVAKEIAELIHKKPEAVIGSITGSTPLMVLENLASYKREGLDFSRSIWFGMDEYYPISSDAPLSYNYFNQTKICETLGVTRLYMPKGTKKSSREIEADCHYHERLIKKCDGVDLQLVGIGRNGHIGFNEPGSESDSRTRLVDLHCVTRADAAKEFGELDWVPRQAITMGVATIKEAKRILFMALGEKKASIVRDALMLSPTSDVPATFLRDHPCITYYLDHAAAAEWRRATMTSRPPLIEGHGLGSRS